MFHFGECLQFSIDNRPSHHQCVMVFSKGDGRKSKKKCCLNGVGSHWLSPESNILDPHLITSQKNRERKRRAVEPRKVFTSFLRPLSNLPSIFNGETYSSRTNTSHIALILIDLDINSPFYYLQHGITICPLGTTATSAHWLLLAAFVQESTVCQWDAWSGAARTQPVTLLESSGHKLWEVAVLEFRLDMCSWRFWDCKLLGSASLSIWELVMIKRHYWVFCVDGC